KEFILSRIGNIGREIIESAANANGARAASRPSATPPLWRRLGGRVKRAPGRLRERLKMSLLSERERQALTLGMFRLIGEAHLWLYDQYSLRRLLERAGFGETRRTSATESRIADWETYSLDVGADGAEHAPSSLYMEGVKP